MVNKSKNNNNKTKIYTASSNDGDNQNQEEQTKRTIQYNTATGQFTELKIKSLKESEQEASKELNFMNSHNLKSFKNNKQQLFNMVNKDTGPQMNYIEKAFAGVQVYELPFGGNSNANPRTTLDTNKDSGPNQGLYHLQAFDPNNITIELLNKIKKKSVINPYSETTYDRMEESFRTDGALKRGLLKKWDFILGANMKVILQLTNDYDSRQDMRKMLKVINKFIPYKTALNESRHILKAIKFKEALYDGGVQSSVYNRAAIEKIRAFDNTIIGLNVLETRYLGNPIYIPMNSVTNRPIDQSANNDVTNNDIVSNNVNLSDNRTVKSRHIYWKLFGLEYQDPETILNSNNTENIEIIQMKDVIYITRDDVSVSPGTKGFGLSEIEPSLDGSETKRIMKSYDFKEISRSSYSSFGVITALNSNITKQELQYLVDAMEVNGWVATAHQIKVETFSLTSDARIMIEILDAMNRETGRDIDVPSPLLGYEHVQNYASLQQTLQSWKESVLDADRRRIRDCIESQLLQEILDTSLKRQGFCIKLNEHFELQLYELDPLTGNVKEEIVLEPQPTPMAPTPPNQEPQEGEDPKQKKKVPPPQKQKFMFEENKYYLNSETGEKKKGSELNALNGNVPPKDKEGNNPDMLANLPRFNKRPVKPTMLYEDEIEGTIELVEVPPIKLSFEISDPNFSIFKDKGEIGLKLKEINAIGVEKLLELMDMTDEIDDAIKRETEQQMIDKKQRETDLLLAQNQMSNMNRKTDAEVLKMNTETKTMGDVDKFLGGSEEANDIRKGKKEVGPAAAEGKVNKKSKGEFF